MSFHRIHESNSKNTQTSQNTSQFAPRPFPIDHNQQESGMPPTQEEFENEAFEQNKSEATRLQLKEKYGAIASAEQKRLGVLQAKMDSFWVQRRERTKGQPNLLEILTRKGRATPATAPAAPIQPKLAIGQPNDQYEQEAERVAEQVISMAPPAASNVQRQTEEEEQAEIQTKPLAETITPMVQRLEASEDEERVQTKCEGCEGEEEQIQRSPDSVAQSQPNLESRLNSSKDGGSPLSDEVRSFMEPRFGFNFSQVRVHTDSEAVQMNRELNAQAFTHGSHIYFGEGKSPAKDNLTAHEMTHVLQQTGGEPQMDRGQSQAAETRQPTSMGSLQRKCTACEAEEKKEDETIQTKAISLSGERVQRSIGGFLNDVTGSLFGNSGNGSETAEFPPCEDARPTPPSFNSWLDNSALESIRHNGKVLSQSESPGGESKEATRLVKQLLVSWGCDFYSQNLLPKFGVNSTFGTETKTAVQKFQTYFALGNDGAIGENTLEAMDVYMGVPRLSKPVKPSDVGGDDAQGKSTFTPKHNPIAQIYFPTNGDTLDKDDVGILLSLANYLENAESVSLNFYGYGDKREAADYNLELADRRVLSVESSLLKMLDERNVNYDWDTASRGEIERPQRGKTSEELKPFRRVDILGIVSHEENKRAENVCPNREPDEWLRSEQDNHRVLPNHGNGEPPDFTSWAVTHYPIDFADLRTAQPEIVELLATLEERIGQAVVKVNPPAKYQRRLQIFGFTDCHEATFLRHKRASGIASELAVDSSFVVANGASAGTFMNPNQDNYNGRAHNRGVLIQEVAEEVFEDTEERDRKRSERRKVGRPRLIELLDEFHAHKKIAEPKLNKPAVCMLDKLWALKDESYTFRPDRPDMFIPTHIIHEASRKSSEDCVIRVHSARDYLVEEIVKRDADLDEFLTIANQLTGDIEYSLDILGTYCSIQEARAPSCIGLASGLMTKVHNDKSSVISCFDNVPDCYTSKKPSGIIADEILGE